MAKTLILLALLVLAVAGAFWWQGRRVERAEMDAGLSASRTLTAVFARTGRLQVAQLSGEAVTRVVGQSGYGLFNNVQTTRAPYSVDYGLDLNRLTVGDYRWNRETRTMVVTIPEVVVGRPNVDMARARSEQAGIYLSRDTGLQLSQRAARNLAAAAGSKAKAPENLARAQAAARDAVGRLVAAPLAAAGLGEVRVVVRLPGEVLPAGLTQERWDESRPIAEVLGR